MSPKFARIIAILLSKDESLLKYTDLADRNIEFTLLYEELCRMTSLKQNLTLRPYGEQHPSSGAN